MEALKLTAVLSLGLLAAPAIAQEAAQPQCAPRDQLTGALTERFGESLASVGLSDAGAAIEMWSSPHGSWSLVISRPDGISCLADFGQGWTVIPQGDPA